MTRARAFGAVLVWVRVLIMCAIEIAISMVAKCSQTNREIVTPAASHKQGCCSASDADDARRVADRLEIPFYAVNFAEEFDRIIDYFVDE